MEWLFGRKKAGGIPLQEDYGRNKAGGIPLQEDYPRSISGQDEAGESGFVLVNAPAGVAGQVRETVQLPYLPSPMPTSQEVPTGRANNESNDSMQMNMLHGVPFCLSKVVELISKLDMPVNQLAEFKSKVSDINQNRIDYDFMLERTVIRD